jgi:hypothetical protein
MDILNFFGYFLLFHLRIYIFFKSYFWLFYVILGYFNLFHLRLFSTIISYFGLFYVFFLLL